MLEGLAPSLATTGILRHVPSSETIECFIVSVFWYSSFPSVKHFRVSFCFTFTSGSAKSRPTLNMILWVLRDTAVLGLRLQSYRGPTKAVSFGEVTRDYGTEEWTKVPG